MERWRHKVKIRHLFTEDENPSAIHESMNAIAGVVEHSPCFHRFSIAKFRTIPAGDEFFRPVDYANKLLDKLYDYADCNRIWIE